MLPFGPRNRPVSHALCGPALLALVCLRCAAADSAPAPPLEVIKVGVFAMTPYVISAPGGPPHGLLIDFFDREIAPRMGVRFQWERPMTMARLEQSLVSGRVMFTPILAQTPARVKAGIQFAGDVHVRLDPCLAVLPDSPLTSVTTPADLANITVGWVQAGALPAFMQDRRIRLDRIGSVEWTNANLEKLRLGRIDAAYFSNPYTPQFFAAQAGMTLRLVKMPVQGPKLYGAFARAAPRSLGERYERAADEAFAGDRFSLYMHKAVLAQVLAAPPKADER
jgi:ABC-type amino acid transport substrate-binding protein